MDTNENKEIKETEKEIEIKETEKTEETKQKEETASGEEAKEKGEEKTGSTKQADSEGHLSPQPLPHSAKAHKRAATIKIYSVAMIIFGVLSGVSILLQYLDGDFEVVKEYEGTILATIFWMLFSVSVALALFKILAGAFGILVSKNFSGFLVPRILAVVSLVLEGMGVVGNVRGVLEIISFTSIFNCLVSVVSFILIFTFINCLSDLKKEAAKNL